MLEMVAIVTETRGAVMSDTVMVIALVAAIITVLGAAVTGFLTIKQALNETKEKVAETTKTANNKLDRITVLVDGNYSVLRGELASLKELVARMTDANSHISSAEDARAELDKITKEPSRD